MEAISTISPVTVKIDYLPTQGTKEYGTPLIMVKGDQISLQSFTQAEDVANAFGAESSAYIQAQAIFDGVTPPSEVLIGTYLGSDAYKAVTGLTITPSAITGTVGDTINFKVAVQPSDATEQDLVAFSSDTSIVTSPVKQQDGSFSAKLGKGGSKATLSVKSVSSPEIVATVAVTVLAAKVDVTGITVAPTSINAKYGDTGKLAVSIQPSNATDQDVSVVTNDETLVTVDDGGNWSASASKSGQTTIKVASKDNPAIATTVPVTVSAPSLTGYAVTPSSVSMAVGATSDVKISQLPFNADAVKDSDYTVTIGDTDTATVAAKSGATNTYTVTGVKAGSTTGSVVNKSDGNVKATFAITVTE